jgi:hypothetical protein
MESKHGVPYALRAKGLLPWSVGVRKKWTNAADFMVQSDFVKIEILWCTVHGETMHG